MKKKKPISLLCLLLVISTVISTMSLLSGCGDNEEVVAGTTSLTEASSVPAQDVIYSDVPSGDYGGYEFRVLNSESNFAYTIFDAESMTGEILNDAIYNRNRLVEEKLNIKIIEKLDTCSNTTEAIQNSINSGSDDYDIFFNEVQRIAPFVVSDSLVDVYDVPGLNLIKSWWDKNAIDTYTIQDKLYMLHGELHLMNQESAAVMMFNKDLAENYQIPNLYELIKSGKWTVEKFNEFTKLLSKDLDGDDKITGFDQFGMTTYSYYAAFLAGFGAKIFEKDSDGIPVFPTVSDKLINSYDTIVNVLKLNDAVADPNKTKNITPDDGANSWHKIYLDGRSLFYGEYLGSSKKLKAMESNFGIIPLPKYDEGQENYYSFVPPLTAAMAIPVTNTDLERTGVILENLCAESHKTIQPAYYDVVLATKTVRDEESIEMLDLIFNNRVYELGAVYGWGNLYYTVVESATRGKKDIMSALEARREITQKALDEMFKK